MQWSSILDNQQNQPNVSIDFVRLFMCFQTRSLYLVYGHYMQFIYSLFCIAATCRVDDLRAHYKNTYETARACKGLNLLKAIEYMERVLEHKAIIPFRKYTGGPGRKAMCKDFGHHNGRFPEKSIKHVLMLLKNLKSNAESKGLDVEKCQITH